MRTASSAIRSAWSTRARWTPADRQRIATELGYSETIFIDVPERDASTAHARIFTPATELPFAGHPTVGASWWLRRDRHADPHPAGARGRRAGQLRRRPDRRSVPARNGRRSSRSTTSSPPTNSSPQTRATTPTTLRTTCGRGPIGTTACCAPGCSRPASVCPRTRRPARPPSASPTTSAATSPSCRARGRSSQTQWSPDGWVRVAGRVVNDGTKQID